MKKFAEINRASTGAKKKINLFEKLWEHGRTLRRVGLVLVMCLMTITQVWADDYSPSDMIASGGTKKNHLNVQAAQTTTGSVKVCNVNAVTTAKIDANASADYNTANSYIELKADDGYTITTPITITGNPNSTTPCDVGIVFWTGSAGSTFSSVTTATLPSNASTGSTCNVDVTVPSGTKTIRIYRKMTYSDTEFASGKGVSTAGSGTTVYISNITASASAGAGPGYEIHYSGDSYATHKLDANLQWSVELPGNTTYYVYFNDGGSHQYAWGSSDVLDIANTEQKNWTFWIDNSQYRGFKTSARGEYTFTVDDSDKSNKFLVTVTPPPGVLVTLNKNGHGGSNESWYEPKGSTITEPSTPSNDDHYTFRGWYTDASCTAGNEWDFSTTVDEDITLYAKWIPCYRYYGDNLCPGWTDSDMNESADGLYWWWKVNSWDANREFQIKYGINTYNRANNVAKFHCTDIDKMNNGTDTWSTPYYNSAVYYNGGGDYYIIVYVPGTNINGGANPIICASTFLPESSYAVDEGHKIYFDKSALDWTSLYFRIGHKCWNKKIDMTLVNGTESLYECTTTSFGDYNAFHVADNCAYADEHSIYDVRPGGYNIDNCLVFQKYAIDGDITLTPGEADGDPVGGCQYYSASHMSGMKTDRVTISDYSHGTITVTYDDADGTNNKTFTSGYRDLAHTVKLKTITAVANDGYDASAVTINEGAYSTNYVVTGATTVAATFSPQVYDINYYDCGGGDFSGSHASGYPTTHTYDSETTLKGASMDNYTWDGWYTASNCASGKVTSLGATAYTASPNLYAKFTQTITLDDEGATTPGSTSATAIYKSATLTEITNPKKAGYDFGGWYTGDNGTGTLVINTSGVLQASVDGYTGTGGIWTSSSARTLHALWTEHTYTVTLDADGGSVSPSTLSPVYNSDLGTSSVISSISLSKYTFDGFYTGQGGTGTQLIDKDKKWIKSVAGYTDATPHWIATADETLYAKWTQDVTLHKNGGSSNGKAAVILNSSTASITTAATYSGYTADGYYAEEGCTNLVMSADGTLNNYTGFVSGGKWVHSGSSTLYTHYKINAPSISCSRNMVTISTTATGTTIYYTTNGTTPTTSSSVYSAPFAIAANTTVIAYAVKAGFTDSDPYSQACSYETTYTVSYEKNGGSGDAMASVTDQFAGDKVTTTACTYTYAGHKFKWWNTASNGSGEDFYVGEKVTIASADVPLYAQWESVGSDEAYWVGDNFTFSDDVMSVGDMRVKKHNVDLNQDIDQDYNQVNKQNGHAKKAKVMAMDANDEYLELYFSDGSTINKLYLGATSDQTTDQNIVVVYSATSDFTTAGGAAHEFKQVGETTNLVTIPGHDQTTKSVTDVSPSTEDTYKYVRIYRRIGTANTIFDNTANLGMDNKLRIYSIKAKKGSAGYALTNAGPDNGAIAITSDGSSAITESAAGETVYITATPSTGYHFSSWDVYKTDASGTKVDLVDEDDHGSFTMPSYAVTVDAAFAINSHTLIWDFDGGETSATEGDDYTTGGSVNYNTALTYPADNTMSKDGYDFNGWSSKPAKMPDDDLTITAQWAKLYRVDYNVMGGDALDPAYEMGSSVTTIDLPTPERSGYTFEGWYTTAGDLVDDDPYTPTADITLYAKWLGDCDADDPILSIGATTQATSSFLGTYSTEGITLSSSESWTYEDKKNDGSFVLGSTSSGYDNCYFEVLASSADIDKVSFLLTGNGTNKSLQPVVFGWASTASATADTYRMLDAESVSDKGWGNAEWFTYDFSESSVKRLRIYRASKNVSSTSPAYTGSADYIGNAQTIWIYGVKVWLKGGGSGSCYTVTYNGNGATSGYVNDPTQYAENATVSVSSSSGSYTRTGYEFNGWNTKADGSGTKLSSFTITRDTTLYAQWRIVISSDNTNFEGKDTPTAYKDVKVTNGATLTITNATTMRDVTVTNGATLKIQKGTNVHDITVETGSTLNIAKDGESGVTLTANSLALKGGWDEDKENYDMPRVYIDQASTFTRTESVINFDISVDYRNYYPFALPFDVTINDDENVVDYAESYIAAASTYGMHYAIREYDGEQRAEGKAAWKYVSDGTTLKAGKGYILYAKTVGGKGIIRFPMDVADGWLALGEQGSYDAVTKNQVEVTAWGWDEEANEGAGGWKEGVPDSRKGWNLLGVPFMSCFATSDASHDEDVEGDAYIKGKLDFSTNKYDEDDDNIYVTVPVHDFSEYIQSPIDEAVLLPGWCFFIQVAKSGTLTFAVDGQEETSTLPIYAPKQEKALMPTVKTGIILSGANASDKTTFLVSDKYSAADYEINADLEKMFGENSFTLATYSLSGETRLAYNALSNADAANIIPIGYRAPADGEYTFSINPRYAENGAFEHVNLIDYETGIMTDLLMGSYTFSTERTQLDTRFALNVVPRKETPTDIENGASGINDANGPRKVLINDKMYIIIDGKMYDATGKAVK